MFIALFKAQQQTPYLRGFFLKFSRKLHFWMSGGRLGLRWLTYENPKMLVLTLKLYILYKSNTTDLNLKICCNQGDFVGLLPW